MWWVLQHVAWEGPGLVVSALRERSLGYKIVRLDEGGSVPHIGLVEGLVVMGGTMGAYETDKYPFLEQEIELLGACVAQDIPVLGICLGAQLLAASLGATVERGPVMEIGAGEVMLTEDGRQDPVLGFGPARLPVAHWHQDTYPQPPGAALLASSALYPQQAFRAGHSAYGLQFHIEVDEALAAAWRPRGLDLTAAQVKAIGTTGRQILQRFLDVTAEPE
ncbi:MAG: type 1 glutamine amidotransferase [Terriglobales bacterium]